MNLYSTKVARIVWFVKRFGVKEVILKPLRMVFAGWIIPTLAKKEFVFRGDRFSCLYARYNMTWVGERMVEIPICGAMVAKHAPGLVLEIGNVLSHYGISGHVIVDKYEYAPGVINEDILNYRPGRRFELIVSISTFEHIGFDDDCEGSSGDKILAAIRHCRGLLVEGGRLVITFPTGYNPELDLLVGNGSLGADRLSFMKRVGVRDWKECDSGDALKSTYRLRFPYGNSLVVAEFGSTEKPKA